MKMRLGTCFTESRSQTLDRSWELWRSPLENRWYQRCRRFRSENVIFEWFPSKKHAATTLRGENCACFVFNGAIGSMGNKTWVGFCKLFLALSDLCHRLCLWFGGRLSIKTKFEISPTFIWLVHFISSESVCSFSSFSIELFSFFPSLRLLVL